VSFKQALDRGELDHASAILDELARRPDTGGLWMPECYADLARAYDQHGRRDEAIAAIESAIDHGWHSAPDARSDIAEFHLRAGRSDEAAAIWEQLKTEDPDDVWLYNAAGLSYGEIGEHELAVAWLGDGLELAMRTDDPEGIVAQLSDFRRRSLEAVRRELDELEQRVDRFLELWNASKRDRQPALYGAFDDAPPPADAPVPAEHRGGKEIVVALAWFPSGEYQQAIERWPSLAEGWADVAHRDYCHRIDGHIKWMRAHGVQVRAGRADRRRRLHSVVRRAR